MRCFLYTGIIALTALLSGTSDAALRLAWPPSPATARVEYVREISLGDLKPHAGFLKNVVRMLSGSDSGDVLRRPFSLAMTNNRIFLTCQDMAALAVVDPESKSYRLYSSKEHPLVSPIALAGADEVVYMTDSGSAAIYRFKDGDLMPWVTVGLVRPTGIAYLEGEELIVVVDTGDHQVKVFDRSGNPVLNFGQRGEQASELNFPTFVTVLDRQILVSDTMNYSIKRFSRSGELLQSIGQEGSVPGSFARPKGVAVDGDGNTWVVDALFDNIQIFNSDGRLLLVVGGPGQNAGEFWSPTGITVQGDEIYIADTYNDRIQVLRYLGGKS